MLFYIQPLCYNFKIKKKKVNVSFIYIAIPSIEAKSYLPIKKLYAKIFLKGIKVFNLIKVKC